MISPTELRDLLQSIKIDFHAGQIILDQDKKRLGVISLPPATSPGDPDEDTIYCNVPGCKTNFSSASQFESHYNSLHRFNCAQCKRNLPSAHLLDMHLEEIHDSYFEVLSKTKPSFRCFMEDCNERFFSTSERKDHGIKAHSIPSNFRFATKEKKTPDDPEVLPEEKEEGKAQPMKKITFGHHVPKSFDTGYAKALTKNAKTDMKRGAQGGANPNPLEDNKMVVDLLESLPK